MGLENLEAAKTLLCFMIKSVGGRYCDTVAMVPLTKIDSKIIKKWFYVVLKTVTEIGFDPVVAIADAHSANRKFFAEELSGESLRPYILNPNKPDSRIYLLFDSVHVFKNCYNNLLNKKDFKCPDFQNKKVSASKSHVQALYNQELGNPVRYAHKLNDKVLNPKPIERTKVILADSFFHESTIAGLRQFSNVNWKWEETANFLALIRRFWNTVNCKSSSHAQQKRDQSRKSIDKNDLSQVVFLREFYDWICAWEELCAQEDLKGLTKETFLALKQTCLGLSDLAVYLLDTNRLDYVLLGKISTDPLESRFGWFRQLAGANYFLSVRQFFEAEKKIRIQALIKWVSLNVEDVWSVMSSTKDAHRIQQTAEKLCESISNETNMNPSDYKDELGAIFYVAGYIARGAMKNVKCEGCPNLLIASRASPEVDFSTSSFQVGTEGKQFLDLVNRGGLMTPSDLLYLCCLTAFKLHKDIFKTKDTERVFLSCQYQLDVFMSIFNIKAMRSTHLNDLFSLNCEECCKTFLSFVPLILRKFFHVMMKNFIEMRNSEIHKSRKREAKKSEKEDPGQRKCKKLQSDS